MIQLYYRGDKPPFRWLVTLTSSTCCALRLGGKIFFPEHKRTRRNDMTILQVVLVLLVLIIAFTLVFLAFLFDRSRSPSATLPTTTPGFLGSCATTACAPGLLCDAAANYVCKYSLGQTCASGADCATGSYCSGVCVSGPYGGFQQYCPCAAGYTCVANPGAASTCAVALGGVCTNNSDCSTGNCVTGTCALLPNGANCGALDSLCVSGNCSNGLCQPPGVISGGNGAACSNLNCNSTLTTGTCTNGGECVCTYGAPTGVCTDHPLSLNSACSSLSPCENALMCLDQSSLQCGADSDANCTCLFNYSDPNANQDCPGGLVGGSTICLNGPGLGCDNNSQCGSGQCSTGGGSLVLYDLTTPLTVTPLITNGLGAVTRLLAVSDGASDTIYAVDTVQGICQMTYNSGTGVATAWTVILPSTSTMYPVNAAYASMADFTSTFYIVFMVNGTYAIYTWDLVNTPLPLGAGVSGYPAGSQSTGGGTTPLNIYDIDVSYPNDAVSATGNDLLVVSDGVLPGTYQLLVATNPTAGTYAFMPAVQQGGPNAGGAVAVTTSVPRARFYYDTIQTYGAGTSLGCGQIDPSNNGTIVCPPSSNFTYIGAADGQPGVVIFSGNVAGTAGVTVPTVTVPQDRFYGLTFSVYNYSIFVPGSAPLTSPTNPAPIFNSVTISLAAVSDSTGLLGNRVVVGHSAVFNPVAYQISPNSQPLATANGLYLWSPGTCN